MSGEQAARGSLTQLEQQALGAPINLADGHPRQRLTEGQQQIVARLPALFESAGAESFEQLECRAQRTFFDALGQCQAPVGRRRIFSLYSSSVATMVLARCLRPRRARIALVHPTFDNIPDLLRDSLELVPASEDVLLGADLDRMGGRRPDCVFATTPNNPTGWLLPEEALERLASVCAEADLLLCLDTSFRGFDTRAQFDGYAVLDRTGVDYVVIEDTGKLWPMGELKVAFMAVSESMRDVVANAVADVLLSVSPFVLRLVEELATDAVRGGFAQLHRLIAANRAAAIVATQDMDGVVVPNADVRVSVSRIRFRSAQEADRIRSRLRLAGVHVLPGRQFHWADPEQGATDLRIALARSPEVVVEALRRLRAVAGVT